MPEPAALPPTAAAALAPIPVRTHTDLPPASLKSVRALAHRAAQQCHSDQEFAALVQLGLEGCLPAAGRWCVLAGRGTVAYRCRFQRGTRALLRLPCLAVDLARDGTAPPGLALSCLVFQPMDDEGLSLVTRGPRLALAAAAAEEAAAAPAGAAPKAGGGSGAPAAASAEPQQQQPAPQPQPQLQPEPQPRAPLAPLQPADALAPSASAAPEGRAHLGRIVGGVLEAVGLHPGVDVAFCSALKEALQLEYGEGTWHVFLGQAAPGAAAAAAAAPAANALLPAPAPAGKGAPPPPAPRVHTAKERLGFAAVNPSAHAAAVAPSAFVPGSFCELQLAPRLAAAERGRAGGAAAPAAGGPARYCLAFFQTAPRRAARPAAALAQGLPRCSAWAAQPLTALRLALNALGFAAFLCYAVLTHGHSNACSRLKGVGFLGASSSSSGAGAGAGAGAAAGGGSGSLLAPVLALALRLRQALELFSPTPGVAEAALGLPLLPAVHHSHPASLGGDPACSLGEVLAADLRIARGRCLILATLAAIVLSVVVLKPAQRLGEGAQVRGVLGALRREDAVRAAQTLRSASKEE